LEYGGGDQACQRRSIMWMTTNSPGALILFSHRNYGNTFHTGIYSRYLEPRLTGPYLTDFLERDKVKQEANKKERKREEEKPRV
jgi:hypothetical protein